MNWGKWAALAALGLGVFMTKDSVMISGANFGPRGIRNNNPLNIRVGNDWQGEAQSTDGDFEQFESVEMGIRAAAKLLKNYRTIYGATTIRAIIARWAPDNENDTDSYIASVAQRAGIPAGKVLHDSDYVSVIEAMIYHENGQQPYDLVIIENGFKMGFYS